MALPASGAISLNNIQQEFGGSAPTGINEYYRKGTRVPDLSYNQNIPTSGTISFDDFHGARAERVSTTTVPAYSTTSFKASGTNDVRTYRVVHEFDITENSRFEFAVDYEIMGDERESDTFTSTNTQFVRNPHIAIYVGGTALSGTTEPSGTKVLVAESDKSSNNDNGYVAVSADVANVIGEYGGGPAKAYVVFSMVCGDRGGPDAPLSRWRSPAFDVTIKTG